jgi:GTP-binding protein YchF
MGLKCGIVGLPNVGKSTFFNAITETASAEAANYPFCTIEPNSAMVKVEDHRLYQLASIANSIRIVPAFIEFVDIAGLVAGASKGEGLGNKFLSHVREVDAILHVVRCFDDNDVLHVNGKVNPVSDIATVENELILSDMSVLEKHIDNYERKARCGDKIFIELRNFALSLMKILESGNGAHSHCDSFKREKELREMQLITSKPVIYVCNVAEKDIATGNSYSQTVFDLASSRGFFAFYLSAKIESEIALLTSNQEKKEFLASLGVAESGISKVVRRAYSILGLESYFTVGENETRMWTIKKGTKAPQAAGIIHSDFEDGFIRAEVSSYEDYVASAGRSRPRSEGKDYVVQDGDIINFLFNKTQSKSG